MAKEALELSKVGVLALLSDLNKLFNFSKPDFSHL